MGFIIKDTAALINTKLTDAARKKISEGTFNIAYFQVGDSEVCYNCGNGVYHSNGMVLDAEYNSQNLSPLPQKSKSNIQYHILTSSQSTDTFGIPIAEPQITNIFNTAAT